jgi:putative transposase
MHTRSSCSKWIEGQWQDLRVSKLHDDLCDLGETCCPTRVARLAKLAGVYAQIGDKRRPGKYGGKPSVVVDNTLDRQCNVAAPNKVWVTDITYIKRLCCTTRVGDGVPLYAGRI